MDAQGDRRGCGAEGNDKAQGDEAIRCVRRVAGSLLVRVMMRVSKVGLWAWKIPSA